MQRDHCKHADELRGGTKGIESKPLDMKILMIKLMRLTLMRLPALADTCYSVQFTGVSKWS